MPHRSKPAAAADRLITSLVSSAVIADRHHSDIRTTE